MSWVYLDDSFLQKKDAKISPFDRGFLFGDAVYEVIPVYERKIFLFSEHMTRLERSLLETGIDKPKVWNRIPTIIDGLVKKNAHSNQKVYLQISRGVDIERDHLPSKNLKPTLFISSSELFINPYRLNPNKPGLDVNTSKDPRWKRCDIKAVTLLSNVLALREADLEGKDEVIFHRDGKVTEGTSSNVFTVFGEEILTPPESELILSGITRKYVINLLKSKNLSVLEREIDVLQLYEADEVWMTSSTKEIHPVKKINNKELKPPKPQNSIWFNVLSSFI